MFIDIHTHDSKSNKNSIYNVVLGKDTVPKTGWYSIGVHPWYLEGAKKKLKAFESTLDTNNPNLVFVGECGLDKMIATDLALQEIVFKAQIELSEKYKKPLTVHCVKAFNELIQIKRVVNPIQTWIIHGFNRTGTIASSVLKEGFYLSFGYKYLKTEIGKEVLKTTPIEKIFFETDNNTSFSIEEVYILGAEILQVELEQLKIQIKKNLWKVTGWKEQSY